MEEKQSRNLISRGTEIRKRKIKKGKIKTYWNWKKLLSNEDKRRLLPKIALAVLMIHISRKKLYKESLPEHWETALLFPTKTSGFLGSG